MNTKNLADRNLAKSLKRAGRARLKLLENGLTTEQRKALLAKLARFTSLPAAWIDRNDLKITPTEFRKQLLTEDRRIIGRFDARIAGFDPRPNSPMSEYDPSLTFVAICDHLWSRPVVSRDLPKEHPIAPNRPAGEHSPI